MKTNFYFDIPVNWALGFQDPCTPAAIAVQDLHWKIMIILTDIFIFVSVFLILAMVLFSKSIHTKYFLKPESFNESIAFEFFITAFSAILLLFIGIPGLSALYSLEESLSPIINIKVIGKQWQWSYEYSDYTNLETGETISFDSAPVLASEELDSPVYNLLTVDQSLVLPVNVPINFVITSTDVIHSWALPSAGIKMDAIPGRLNTFTTVFNREGTFFGQCSELCGTGHAFMPICVKVVSFDSYINFISQ